MEIQDLRKQIDSIDDELVQLFVRRMTLCAGIAEQKALSGKPVIDAGREREILSRVTRSVPEDLGGYSRELFTTMFRLSRAYQTVRMSKPGRFSEEIAAALENSPKEFPKTATVACQGVEGAYSQQACDKIFSFADIMFFKSFDGVFNAVEKGLCKYGVLPIENSSHGSVDEVYDLMRNHSFHIVHSTKLRISHDLLAAPGTKLEDVREIVSHEQALGQCSKLIAELPNVRITVCENTAAAA
jgi:chorismate mutase/prephenate dehydratase